MTDIEMELGMLSGTPEDVYPKAVNLTASSMVEQGAILGLVIVVYRDSDGEPRIARGMAAESPEAFPYMATTLRELADQIDARAYEVDVTPTGTTSPGGLG